LTLQKPDSKRQQRRGKDKSLSGKGPARPPWSLGVGYYPEYGP